MTIVRVILVMLTMFSLLLSFTFYYRERPNRPTRAFIMLIVTIVLLWLNYFLRGSLQ